MKFHPILFSTPMVQAIGDGTKKQTRRTKGLERINLQSEFYRYDSSEEIGNHFFERLDFRGEPTEDYQRVDCPYQVGDVFWVKETFRAIDQDNGSPRIEYKATEKINLSDKWKPSIFMPKSAARYFLRIKSIKAERLQEISEADAIAEGIAALLMSRMQLVQMGQKYFDYTKPKQLFNEGLSPFWSFNSLWCSINGSESWESNPFVWIYEFEKIEKPYNFIQADN